MIEHCVPTKGIGLVGVAQSLVATGGVGLSPGQGLHARRRGRIIREVEAKSPEGLEKGPPPPPPDFTKTVETPVRVDIFKEFTVSSPRIVFKGMKIADKDQESSEDDDIEVLSLILSELD